MKHRSVLGLTFGAGDRTFPALLLVLAYLFLVPNVDLAPSLSWHDGQRLAQLVVLAGMSLLIVTTPASKCLVSFWQCLSIHLRRALVLFFVIGLLSSLRAPLPAWALLDWAMYLLLFVLLLLLASTIRAHGESADRLIVLALFLMAAGYSGKVMVTYLAMVVEGPRISGAWFDMRDFYTGFSNIRFFGHLQTMVLPLLILPGLWWGRTKWLRAALLLPPVIWWALVTASGSRGTWAGLFAGFLAVLLFGGLVRRRWCQWQLVCLLCGGLAHFLAVTTMPLGNPYNSAMAWRETGMDSLSRRDELWALTLRQIAECPWLGLGPMHFAYAPNPVAAHPHSALLQFMVEWGIPAALLLGAVLVTAGICMIAAVRKQCSHHSKTPDKQLLFVALLASLTGATAQSLIDGVLIMPVSQMAFTLLCAWALALLGPVATLTAKVTKLRCRGMAALTIFLVSMVAVGVWPDVLDPSSREDRYYSTRPSDAILMPRFWVQGWIGE